MSNIYNMETISKITTGNAAAAKRQAAWQLPLAAQHRLQTGTRTYELPCRKALEYFDKEIP